MVTVERKTYPGNDFHLESRQMVNDMFNFSIPSTAIDRSTSVEVPQSGGGLKVYAKDASYHGVGFVSISGTVHEMTPGNNLLFYRGNFTLIVGTNYVANSIIFNEQTWAVPANSTSKTVRLTTGEYLSGINMTRPMPGQIAFMPAYLPGTDVTIPNLYHYGVDSSLPSPGMCYVGGKLCYLGAGFLWALE